MALWTRTFSGLVLSATLPALVLISGASQALAQSLVITDCQGFTRALQRVDPGQLNNVDINVTDALGNPAEGVEVSITNTATGEVVTVASESGVATFEGMGAGTFSVSTTATGTSIGAISIAPIGAGVAAAAGATAVAGVAGGGGIVGIGLAVDSVVGITDPGSSSSEPTPDPTVEPTPEPTPRPTDRPTPLPTPDDCHCDPDATPPPLSPFR